MAYNSGRNTNAEVHSTAHPTLTLEAVMGAMTRVMRRELEPLQVRLDQLEGARRMQSAPRFRGHDRVRRPDRGHRQETDEEDFNDGAESEGIYRRSGRDRMTRDQDDSMRGSKLRTLAFQGNANPWRQSLVRREERPPNPKPASTTEPSISRARDTKCYRGQVLGHVARKCPNQRAIMLRDNGGYEIEEEEDKDSMFSLVDTSVDECVLQGVLVVAINATRPWKDRDATMPMPLVKDVAVGESVVTGELLLANKCNPSLEDSEKEYAAQGDLLKMRRDLPPLEAVDNKKYEHAVRGEHLVMRRPLPLLEAAVVEKSKHAAHGELLVARRALSVQAKEDQCKDLGHYDFIGIEQILSKCCSTKIIASYLRSCWIRSWLALFAMKMSKKRPKASTYSKYLFRWRGRYQYLHIKDPKNSRTNSFQEGENDENMAGLKAWLADPLQVPDGPTTRAKAKAFREALNGLVKEGAEQATWARPIEGLRVEHGLVHSTQAYEGEVAHAWKLSPAATKSPTSTRTPGREGPISRASLGHSSPVHGEQYGRNNGGLAQPQPRVPLQLGLPADKAYPRP